jgi:hypothetical protein
MTVSEALSEIKLLSKRIADKRDFIHKSLGRPEFAKDPFAAQGGAPELLRREFQAMTDLEERIITLRLAILTSNATTTVAVQGEHRTIQAWLTARREVLPQRRQFINGLLTEISTTRANAQKQGNQVVAAGAAQKETDLILHVDEAALYTEREQIDVILGELDGRLSQSNATVQI